MTVIKVVQVVNDLGIPFHVRMVKKGDFYGAFNDIKHLENEPFIEVYDNRFGKGFTLLGQFVTRYEMSTIVNHVGDLSMHYNVDEWHLTGQNVKSINGWLKNIKSSNSNNYVV